MEIGRRIRELREERGLTARDLSHRIDLTETSIYRIERGERIPSAATVEAIARGLGVAPGELFEESVAAPLAEARPDPGDLVDMSEAEFSRVLSDATGSGTLKELYRKIDAERTHRELQWREDEGNTKVRDAYARSARRRMLVLLSLPEARFVKPSDLALPAKELEKSVKIGHLDQ